MGVGGIVPSHETLTMNLLQGEVLKEYSGLFPREYDVSLNVTREVTASHSLGGGSHSNVVPHVRSVHLELMKLFTFLHTFKWTETI